MVRFAHITDLHYAPMPPVREKPFNVKQWLGWMSWIKKRQHRHLPEVIAALEKDLLAQVPDHICVTGDQTNLAQTEEFEVTAAWLETLGAPENVSVIPGNHDAYADHWQDSMWQNWRPWMTGDDGRSDFPYVRRRGDIAFIGVSSAVPTPPFFAFGEIGKSQLAKLAQCLDGTKDLCRVVMVHHAPYDDGISGHRALKDADALGKIIAAHGAELILHGHEHKALEKKLPGPHRDAHVFGAASASMGENGHYPPAQYYIFDVAPQNDGWSVTVTSRGYAPQLQNFKQLNQEDIPISHF